MTWKSFKEKLGYGTLADEDSISLVGAVKSKSRFDSVVNEVVTELLAQLIEPWLESCLVKYTETDFHKRMLEGFDFIQDWKSNHHAKYAAILRALRSVRHRIILDESKIYDVIIAQLSKNGWKITDWEKTRFMENIRTLIQEIYS